MAWWSGRHYDRYVDREVRYLRHALSIDEDRAKFPNVPWGRSADLEWNLAQGNENWMKQVWFAGNHSDIGGSYLEEESRLSDFALEWMVQEVRQAVPDVQIRGDLLICAPDHMGLQHDEPQSILDAQPAWLRKVTRNKLTWTRKGRTVPAEATLHPSVGQRVRAAMVPQMGDMKPYRPFNLSAHKEISSFLMNENGTAEI